MTKPITLEDFAQFPHTARALGLTPPLYTALCDAFEVDPANEPPRVALPGLLCRDDVEGDRD